MRITSLASILFSAGLFTSIAATSCSSSDDTPATTATDSGASSSGSSGAEEDAGGTGEDAAPAGPMTITSTEYKDGDLFPKKYTCDGVETNSPPLTWTAGPEGTLSYAIVFNDKTLDFRHSAIYDIPADVTSLPENVEPKYEPKTPAGAKQALNYKSKPGFIGPCPPSGEHTYEMILYALKVDKLAGLSQTSDANAVRAAAEKQKLATAKLSGRYTKAK